MNEDLKSLRQAMATQELSNSLSISNSLDSMSVDSDGMFKEMCERLAVQLVEEVARRGFMVIPDTGRAVYLESDHWMRDYSQVCMKLRAGLRTDPLGFACLVNYMIVQERDRANSERLASNEWRGRYEGLLRNIATARSMRQLKKLVIGRQEDDE